MSKALTRISGLCTAKGQTSVSVGDVSVLDSRGSALRGTATGRAFKRGQPRRVSQSGAAQDPDLGAVQRLNTSRINAVGDGELSTAMEQGDPQHGILLSKSLSQLMEVSRRSDGHLRRFSHACIVNCAAVPLQTHPTCSKHK